jgi:hypothetical protein
MQKRVEKSGSDACAFHVKICVSIILNLMTGLEMPVTEARVGKISIPQGGTHISFPPLYERDLVDQKTWLFVQS